MTSERHPVRLLHLITSLEVGGTELTVLRISDGLRRRGFAPTVVALSGPEAVPDRFANAGVPVISLGAQDVRDAPGVVDRFVRLVRTLRPAIIHGWMYHAHCMSIGALACMPRAALVWSIRTSANPGVVHPRHTRVAQGWARRFSRLPRAILFNSQASLETHRRAGFDTARAGIIPNGVDCHLFKPDPETRTRVRRELGVEAHELLVGHVARFHPVKDHRTLLEAVALLRRWGHPMRAVLVGRDTDGRGVASLVRSLGIGPAVIALGERTDVASLTAAFDVAVSTSISESSSNAVAEAMACRVPCVSTDVGDARETLHGCGVIVPAGDPYRVAKGLREVMVWSPGERARIGAAARRRALDRFSLEQCLDRHYDVYASLLPHATPVREGGGPRDALGAHRASVSGAAPQSLRAAGPDDR
jgi:glycosyltransferase involved in cell wall biosynthesis